MKTSATIYQKIAAELLALEQERQLALNKKRPFNRGSWVIGISVLIAAVVSFTYFDNPILFFVAFFLGVVAVSLLQYFGGDLIRKYRVDYAQKVIQASLSAFDPRLSYHPKDYISASEFIASKLFREKIDRYGGNHLITGWLGETYLKVSDLLVEYRTQDDKGRSQYHTIFKGMFMVADFHKDFQGSTYVLPDTSERLLGSLIGTRFQKAFGRADLVYLENKEFEKQFVVYSNDPIEARYILSTSMMDNILNLQHRVKKDIHLAFHNSLVYLAISDYSKLFKVKTKLPANEYNQFNRFFHQTYDWMTIIDTLNLNLRIWSKQKTNNKLNPDQ